MTRRPLILLATAGLLALASCSLTNASRGELGNGQFTYQCVDSSDAACDSFSSAVSIPDLLAVGGTFDLEYVADSSESAPLLLSPASEKMVSSASGNFAFLRPGVSAVLARSTSNEVADFIHLRGVSIDHLDVAGSSSTKVVTEVEMDAGNEVELQALPKDGSGAILSGALVYAWSTSDSTIVSLGTTNKRNRAALTAQKPGKATVIVSLPSGVKQALLVTVNQETNPSTSSGGEGGSGSSSTGSTGAGGAGGGQ